MFQSTPAFSGEGTNWECCLFGSGKMFQSTPAFSGEGTDCHGRFGIVDDRFNPPPPFQAREPGTLNVPLHRGDVSIHPRLFRRGNRKYPAQHYTGKRFNPPPPFQARELYCA